MKAAQERKEKSTPPTEVTDASKRQYKAGSPGAEPYKLKIKRPSLITTKIKDQCKTVDKAAQEGLQALFFCL